MRAACYIRVSTEEQAREGVSLSAQQQALLAYCRSQAWMVADFYRDDGASGKDLKRAGVQAMLADAAQRKFDVLLVWKLDRLSRRQRDLLHVIEDVLLPAGVGFKSATESFDTTTPGGRAMLAMLGVFAQLERDTIIERTRAGMNEAVRQGTWVSGRPPYGYRLTDEGLAVNEDTAPFVALIFQMAAQGRGVVGIVEELNGRGAPRARDGRQWYRYNVGQILASRVYLGETRWQGEWVKGSHPALIDEALWRDANASRATRANRPSSRSLLSGLLLCGACGAKMRLHRRKVRDRVYCHYECTGKPGGCTAPLRPMDATDKSVIERICAAVQDEQLMRECLDIRGAGEAQALRREDASLAKTEAEAQKRIDNLIRAVEDGGLDFAALKARMADLERERTANADRRREIAAILERASAGGARVADARKRVRRFCADMRSGEMPAERARAVLRQIVAEVKVGPDGAIAQLRLR